MDDRKTMACLFSDSNDMMNVDCDFCKRRERYAEKKSVCASYKKEDIEPSKNL